MKKLNLLTIIIMLAFAGVSFGQITGTPHDFSADGFGTTEICIVCHTPHNALQDVSGTIQPLWNHDLAVTTYALYSSTTFNASSSITQPNGSSKLCLSCHDGSVAIDNFSGATGTNFVTGSANIGGTAFTDLTNDHPISFTYNAALENADGGLHDPTSTAVSALLSTTGEMQCSSCHDAHSNANGSFLVMSNAGSALCIICHDK